MFLRLQVRRSPASAVFLTNNLCGLAVGAGVDLLPPAAPRRQLLDDRIWTGDLISQECVAQQRAQKRLHDAKASRKLKRGVLVAAHPAQDCASARRHALR